MQSVDIALHFNGKSEPAMLYYKTIFGGDFISFQRYKDMPGSDKMQPGDLQKIVHSSLKIAPHTILMASDLLGGIENDLTNGNNFHICLQAESEKEADKLFMALSKDGNVEMPMNKTFWGAYFGMCQDQFGIFWMISYTYPQSA